MDPGTGLNRGQDKGQDSGRDIVGDRTGLGTGHRTGHDRGQDMMGQWTRLHSKVDPLQRKPPNESTNCNLK